jgi:hypothetical protein
MARRTTHGAYRHGKETPEHATWRDMLARCTRPTAKSYSRYGARGITVCTAWLDYSVFIADMGVRPSPEHSLERKNNDLGYSPTNCEWASRSTQARNRRSSKYYFNGYVVLLLCEAAAFLGISKELAYWRYKNHGTFAKGTTWQELQRG